MSTQLAERAAGAEPVLSIEALSKTFSGRRVLTDVSLDVKSGEIVGLLGQNGSGKSTLIKIVSGFYEPDEGATIEVNGEPLEATRMGSGSPMAFVHQNLGLFDTMPVLDNLMANRWARGGGRIQWKGVRESARALLDEFHLPVPLDALVGSLPSGDRAVLAIARAVGDLQGVEQGLLVLDEPTPYLARDEVGRLFKAMRAAAARGIGILFVSHRLDEVQEATDRVVVLRDGRVVGNRLTSEVSEDDIIELIVGRSITDFYPTVPEAKTERLLEVRELSVAGGKPVSFEVSKGEIVGLTGLLGSGFETVPYVLAGARHAESGTATVDGTTVDLTRTSPGEAMSAGLVLVPADRGRLGVTNGLSVRENVTLPWVSRLVGRVGIDGAREQSTVSELLDRFDVRPRNMEALMGTLSGGNQQKTVLARWIADSPKLLVLHEPTQGVDVGARQQIFQQIRDSAVQGMSVIYASLEYEDLAHMCDKVLVFRDGSVAATLTGDEISADRIIEICMRRGNERP